VAHFLHVPDLDRRSVVAQVCGALAHLHAHAVIHRDIKSSNILIKRLRDPVHVVVSDLGVACVGSYNAACIRGDVHWASSEVAFRGHYLPAADMYAVGCVVAELLLRAPEVSRMCGASLLPWHMQAGFAATLAALCDSPRDDDYLTPLMVDLLADTPSLRPAAAAVVSRLRREESAARRIQRAARRRPRRPVNVAVNEKTGAPHCDF
jgi:serine/threonine protein kinase